MCIAPTPNPPAVKQNVIPFFFVYTNNEAHLFLASVGFVQGRLVDAGDGRAEDYDRLAADNVSTSGSIVMVRIGGYDSMAAKVSISLGAPAATIPLTSFQ